MRILGAVVSAVVSAVFLTACSGTDQAGAEAAQATAVDTADLNEARPVEHSAKGQPVAAVSAVDRAARFERTDPSNGTLVLEETGDTFVLSLVAGGRPSGAATAADCAVTIEGPQDLEGVVRGRVVPSSGAYGDMTADDIGPNPLKIDVMIGPEGAFVTDHGAAAKLCGMGSQLDGFYKRLDTPD